MPSNLWLMPYCYKASYATYGRRCLLVAGPVRHTRYWGWTVGASYLTALDLCWQTLILSGKDVHRVHRTTAGRMHVTTPGQTRPPPTCHNQRLSLYKPAKEREREREQRGRWSGWNIHYWDILISASLSS